MSVIHPTGNPPEQYSSSPTYGIPAIMQPPPQFADYSPYNPPPYFQGDMTHNGWNHETPVQMPWSLPLSDDQRIVKFQGDPSLQVPNSMPATDLKAWWHSPQTDYANSGFSGVHGSHKRKIDYIIDGPTRKQLITEEKMAAELDRLHITFPPESRTNSPDIPKHGEDFAEKHSRRLPMLVLSEELKRLQKEPLIPSSLLESFNAPSKAVVLWKPPAGSIRELLSSVSSRPKEEEQNEDAELEKQNENPEFEELMEDEPVAADFENNNDVPYTDHEDAVLDL